MTKDKIGGIILTYEDLLIKYQSVVSIYEIPLEYGLEGAYRDGIIFIDKSLNDIAKKCILAEELGHHFTSSGDILDIRTIRNLKQERKAHIWAVKELITYEKFLSAIKLYSCDYDRAEYLQVTMWFLQDIYSVYGYKQLDYCFESATELCF